MNFYLKNWCNGKILDFLKGFLGDNKIPYPPFHHITPLPLYQLECKYPVFKKVVFIVQNFIDKL